jgi:hypothetical protein
VNLLLLFLTIIVAMIAKGYSFDKSTELDLGVENITQGTLIVVNNITANDASSTENYIRGFY